MANVLLIILLIISIILIGLILIQRSEGGALGIGGGGGGGGGGGLMSGRGTADMVSRMTGVFGAAFLIVCLMISIAFNYQNADKGLLDAQNAQKEILAGEETTTKLDDAAKTVDESKKLEIAPLNDDTVSVKDNTPLVEDSIKSESDANTPKKSDTDH